MLRRMSSSPVRVGFTPTFSINRPSAAAPNNPATMKNAADEKSPGTCRRCGASPCGGYTVVSSPAVTKRTPQLANMRSLWSRQMAGAITVVGPSA